MKTSEYYHQRDSYSKIGGGRMKGISRLVGDARGKVFLDIGCGAGTLGKHFKDMGAAKVTGVDVSEGAILTAKKVLDVAVVHDIESSALLPKEIQEETYDVVVVSEVLEHLFFPEHVLRNVRQITKSSVVITVPNILFWKNRLKIFFGNFEYTHEGIMDRGHIHFFSWKSLQQMINSEGYRIEAVAHHVPTRGTRWIGTFFPGLFAYQFIVKVVPAGTK